MHKSLYLSPAETELFLKLLREVRAATGVTQVELAKRLGVTQGIISKCETGGRRLHVVELRRYLQAQEMDLIEFVKRLDERLAAYSASTRGARLSRRPPR